MKRTKSAAEQEEPAGSNVGVKSVAAKIALSTAVTAVVLVAFYWAMVARGEEPIAPDTITAGAHAAWAERNEREDGSVPTWYPDIYLGMPAHGSFIRPVGNPLSHVHHAFDLNRGTKYCFWLTMGAAGMAALLLRCGASGPAAFLGAFALVFTPYMLGSVNAGHSSKLLTLSFMPVALLGVIQLMERGGLLGVGLAAWGLAFVFWGNHPQLAYYFCLIVGGYVAFWLWKEGRGVRLRRLLQLAVVGVLVAMMISLPFLPAVDYAPESTRGAVSDIPGATQGGTHSWEYATSWSFHPKELVTFLFPAFFGLQGATYWGPLPFTQSSHALGVIVLVFSLIGFGAMTGWRRGLLIAGAVAFLVIGLGRHVPVLYRPMYELLPHFDKFRVPSMAYAVLPLLLAPALAAGLDLVARGRRSVWVDRFVIGALVLFACTLVAGLVGQGGTAAADPAAGWFQSDAERSAGGAPGGLRAERRALLVDDLVRSSLLALVALGAALLRLRGRLQPVVFWVLVGGALCTDLITIDREFYDPRPVQQAEAASRVPAPIVRAISEADAPVRVLPLKLRGGGIELLQGNEFGLDGIQSVGGYHPAGLRRVKDFVLAGAWQNPGLWPALDVSWVVVNVPGVRLEDADRRAIAEALGGLEITATEQTNRGAWMVLRPPPSLGRVFLVPERRVIEDPADRLQQLLSPSLDGSTEVLLERDVPIVGSGTGQVTLVEWNDGRVVADVGGDGGVLVLSEAYHSSWHAEIDGEPLEVLPANHVLMAVAVPSGSHRVVFEFRDDAVRIASVVSPVGQGIALLLVVASVFAGRRRRVRES